jgi:N-acetylmuramoyl-L-alanine amidase
MPGILVETGFITNPDEEQFLHSEQGQDYIASAIYRAFKSYKNLLETKTSFAMSAKPDVQVADTRAVAVKPPADLETLNAGTSATPPPDASPVEFKIQIAVSSRSVAPVAGNFKGLDGVTEYRVGNLYKYAVGSARSFQEAVAYSKQIKEKFPDAFVIAVKENKIIPLDQALQNLQPYTPKN